MDEHDLLEQQKRVRTSVFICVWIFLEALWHLNALFLRWVPPLYLKHKIEAQIPPLSFCQAAVLLEQERQDMVKMVVPQGMVSTIGGMPTLLWTANISKYQNKNIPCIFASGMDPHAPLPPGVSMLPAQKQRIPPPPGEDGREVKEFYSQSHPIKQQVTKTCSL